MPTHVDYVFGYRIKRSTIDCWTVSMHVIILSPSSCVRVVSSTRSGMGKSLFITRLADRLGQYKSTGTIHVTVPIHGPVVTVDTVMESFKDHMKDVTPIIFHFDIAPSVSVWLLWVVPSVSVWQLCVQIKVMRGYRLCIHSDWWMSCVCMYTFLPIILPSSSFFSFSLSSSPPFRSYGRWTQFCFACWSCEGSLTARGGCGGTVPPSCTPLRSHSQSN